MGTMERTEVDQVQDGVPYRGTDENSCVTVSPRVSVGGIETGSDVLELRVVMGFTSLRITSDVRSVKSEVGSLLDVRTTSES